MQATPRTITKNKIKKMMEEELANMKENEFAGMGYSDDADEEHEQVAIEKKNMMMSIEELLIHVSPKEVARLLQDLAAQVEQGRIQERSDAKLQELGPETGHVEGTDPAGVVRQVADDLSEMSDIMRGAPSTTTASEFAGAIQSLSQELVQAADELKIDGPRPAHEGLSEARKRPLKRHRDAFDKNTQMVSDLQKTISSFLKENGAKLNKNHMSAIETMSTRLMHIANSPMIRLEEGNEVSSMITRLEQIGKEIQDANRRSSDPDTIARLDRIDQMITSLFEDMHNLL